MSKTPSFQSIWGLTLRSYRSPNITFSGSRSVIRKSYSLLYYLTWSCNYTKCVIMPALLFELLILCSKRSCRRHWSSGLVCFAYCLLTKSPMIPLLSIAQTCPLLIRLWILKWLALSAILLIWHTNTESYIFGKSRVKSTLGNMGVESRETDICDMSITTASFYVV